MNADPSKAKIDRPALGIGDLPAKALRKTVEWYLANRPWCERVSSGAYRERLGLTREEARA